MVENPKKNLYPSQSLQGCFGEATVGINHKHKRNRKYKHKRKLKRKRKRKHERERKHKRSIEGGVGS